MFQISKPITLRYNEEETAIHNPLIAQYQEKTGIHFGSMKELITHLLRNANTPVIPENIPETTTEEIPVVEAPAENMVVLGEFDRVIMFTPEFEKAVVDYSVNNNVSAETPLTEVLITALQTTHETPEPDPFTIQGSVELNIEIEKFQAKHLPGLLISKEGILLKALKTYPENRDNAIVIGENDVFFTLTADERELVDFINSNRARRFGHDPLPLAKIAHGMMFNDNTTRNMGGAWYTGT